MVGFGRREGRADLDLEGVAGEGEVLVEEVRGRLAAARVGLMSAGACEMRGRGSSGMVRGRGKETRR